MSELRTSVEHIEALIKERNKLREVLFDADGVLEWLEGDSEPWPTEADAMKAYELRKRIEELDTESTNG